VVPWIPAAAGLGVLVPHLLTSATKTLSLLGFFPLKLLSSQFPQLLSVIGQPVLVVKSSSTNGFNLLKVPLQEVLLIAGRELMPLTLLVHPLSMVWHTIGNLYTMIPHPTSGVSKTHALSLYLLAFVLITSSPSSRYASLVYGASC
jgi:hypothetical protein